ncbi:unnamed protein product [Blepharisma stoltei]|uniref:Sel1 repeat family protein n=1 Tax=Blepharisma stoltei TaxID=1481888 RepID=A0AAU9JFX8_9CILI|nr:unnamed protein product [Blepharisma stoltei]
MSIREYFWNDTMARVAAYVPTKKLCRLAVRMFIGTQVFPKNRDMAFKLLDAAAVNSRSLDQLNQIQFSIAQLKKIEAVETGKPQLLKEANNELSVLCREDYIVAKFAMGKELMKINKKANPSTQKQMEVLSRQYLSECAASSYAPSYYYFGMAHEQGIGGPVNKQQAEGWIARAANEDDPKAFFKLSQWYLVKEDKEMYFKYMKLAAELGLNEAQHNLGVYYNEQGDIRKAVAWFYQAAKNAFYPSIINLGIIFLNGRGEFAANPLIAYIWLKNAQRVEDSTMIQKLVSEAEKALDEIGIKF